MGEKMLQEKKPYVCWLCNKPLQKVTCRVCHGEGVIKHLFREKTCAGCNGSGIQYRCQDTNKHRMELFRKNRYVPIGTIGRSHNYPFKYYPKSIQKGRKCSRCGGTGLIVDSRGKVMACPVCRRIRQQAIRQNQYKPPHQGAPPPGHIYWKWMRGGP
jgi:hypothetical protein